MADTIFQTVLPDLKAVDNGDGTYSLAVHVASGGASAAYGSLGASAWLVSANAPAKIKTFAGVLQADGFPVWVCDGANDEVQFLLADAAAAGGMVKMTGPDFTIQADMTLAVSPFNGDGIRATQTLLSVGTNTITFHSPSTMHNARVRATNPDAAVVIVEVTSALSSYWQHNLFNNFFVEDQGATKAHPGILFTVNASTNERSIAYCNIGPLWVYGCDEGVWFYATESGGFHGYVNGNNFPAIFTDQCDNHVLLQADLTGEVCDNVFQAVYMQHSAADTCGIELDPGTGPTSVLGNHFLYVKPYDWGANPSLIVGACSFNYFRGIFPNLVDNGFYTEIHAVDRGHVESQLYLGADRFHPSTTNGCAGLAQVESAAQKVNYEVLDFDQTNIEYTECTVHPEGWRDFHTMRARFYWTTAGGAPGNGVVWGIQGLARSNDDAIDTAFGTAQEVADTVLALGDVHLTQWTSTITLGGTPAANDIVFLRIYRDPTDGSDNMAADARLIAVLIEYQGQR